MPAGYGSHHVSGYTGHVPGARWAVGRRFVPPATPEQAGTGFANGRGHIQEDNHSRNQAEPPSIIHATNGVHFEGSDPSGKFMIDEATQSEMSINLDSGNREGQYGHQSDTLIPPKSQASLLSAGSSHRSMAFDSQGQPVRLPPHASRSFANDGTDRKEATFSPSEYELYGQNSQGMVGRSKSLPRRRVEKDPFEGVESGWWSKGEVLRNKERRELAEKGKASGGDWDASKEEMLRRQWKERESDIPAAGYSGHIQEQFYGGSQFDEGSEQLNLSHMEASGMHSVGPY